MIIEVSEVVSNRELAAGIHRIEFRSPTIASSVKPGQFVNILICDHWEPLLRRPMSVAGSQTDYIQLIYKVVGQGTRTMSTWSSGQMVNLLGPLGNGWSYDPGIYPILLGGGVGIAPILFLHDKLSELGIDHHLVMGARDRTEHFLEHEPEHHILLTTDNGALGIKGTILNGLMEILQHMSSDSVCIYGCGPQPMLKALKEFVAERSLSCQIATEEIMGCGIGICQGCNVEIRTVSGEDGPATEPYYKLACIDGPIFWAHELS